MRDLPAIRRAVRELSREQLEEIVLEFAEGCVCTHTDCARCVKRLERDGAGQMSLRLQAS